MTTATRSISALQAKVNAVNRANAYAAELYPLLVEAMTPFVGQKVEKVDGDLLEKVRKVLPEMPNGVPLHTYRHTSNYSLTWVVKTCESIPPYGCCYHETTVYIGELKNGVLTVISPTFSGRSDYTTEEVREKRDAYAKAKAAADQAHSDLFPFGEYDR